MCALCYNTGIPSCLNVIALTGEGVLLAKMWINYVEYAVHLYNLKEHSRPFFIFEAGYVVL